MRSRWLIQTDILRAEFLDDFSVRFYSATDIKHATVQAGGVPLDGTNTVMMYQPVMGLRILASLKKHSSP
jgi:hypothetical protein